MFGMIVRSNQSCGPRERSLRACSTWVFECHVARRDHNDGEIFVDERDRPVLEFSGSIALGVRVGYFLQLERTFQRKRVVRSAADE
jgi:hypothetical protein